MGTETWSQAVKASRKAKEDVKLNNPQMGTETILS